MSHINNSNCLVYIQVFTGGPELILKVSEAHLEKIFEIIIDCKDPTVQAQFMVTLDSMAKVSRPFFNFAIKCNISSF